MKVIETIVSAFLGLLVIGFIILVVWWGANSCLSLQPDYTAKIVVDKNEKVPIALSNAMQRVTSKGFIITKIFINYNANKGLYTVTYGGVEEATLLKLEK